jgi:hypothetical protein
MNYEKMVLSPFSYFIIHTSSFLIVFPIVIHRPEGTFGVAQSRIGENVRADFVEEFPPEITQHQI